MLFGYNANGCLTSDGIWTHSYDTQDHLLSSSKAGTSLAFSYDPFHRQTEKSVTTAGIAKTRYIYSGWQRLADYDSVTDTLQNRYVYGLGLDEPLIQVSNSGVLTFLHADHLGSIVAISDNSGVVTNKNSYGPFGETSGLAGTTFGYTAQRFDSETGLYYYKNRQYSPILGRFFQPDFIGARLYTYADNNPLNLVDAFGLAPTWAGAQKILLESPKPWDEFPYGCRSLVNYYLGDRKSTAFPEIGALCFYGDGSFMRAKAARDELNKDECCKAVLFSKAGKFTLGHPPVDGPVKPGEHYPFINNGWSYTYQVYQAGCDGKGHIYSLGGQPTSPSRVRDNGPTDPYFIDDSTGKEERGHYNQIWCAKCTGKKDG